MITKVYDREYVTLDYDPSVPCVIATSFKFMTLDEFKLQLNFGLNFMKQRIRETGRMLWLPDITLASTCDREGVKWVREDWTPRAFEAGIRHMALVASESEWAKMGLNHDTDDAEEKGMGMTTAFFKDVESAKKWFSNMKS
ncbi:hypothetical protein [Chryseolinea soli]|nr:hypothetical protein [Chryseolinea soli]